jgi:hypothetical protein
LLKPVLPGTTAAALAALSFTVLAPAAAAATVSRLTDLAGPGPPLLALSRISGRRPWSRKATRRRRTLASSLNRVGSS